MVLPLIKINYVLPFWRFLWGDEEDERPALDIP